jgi:hypothetical protein
MKMRTLILTVPAAAAATTAVLTAAVLTAAVLTTAGSSAQAETALSFVTHQTNLEFVTGSGASPYPTGPLAPGDRIIGRDDILRGHSVIGSDYEACTVTFGLNVLCEDMVSLTGRGDLHVTWTFQWPSAPGSTGPTAWDGVVDGGTGAFGDAHGSFHAAALTGGDISITADIRH